jgi:uncharacterized protein (TIGR02284 family)
MTKNTSIMAQNSETIEILNDLILINNDRIAGYEKARDEANELESDLRSLFNKLADESRQHVLDLKAHVSRLGGEPATGTMLSGKLYRVWMDVRATFTSDNRRAVLENAEMGEDAAKKAYEEALRSDDLSADVRQLILSQQTAILAAHDSIKLERDRQRDVSKYPFPGFARSTHECRGDVAAVRTAEASPTNPRLQPWAAPPQTQIRALPSQTMVRPSPDHSRILVRPSPDRMQIPVRPSQIAFGSQPDHSRSPSHDVRPGAPQKKNHTFFLTSCNLSNLPRLSRRNHHQRAAF